MKTPFPRARFNKRMNARRPLLPERSTDMHEMYMHVNGVDLRIKALIALEVDDPENSFFFCIMTPHYIAKP